MSHLDPKNTKALEFLALGLNCAGMQFVVQVDYARRMEVALRRIASNDGLGSVHPSPCDRLRLIASEALRNVDLPVEQEP